MYKTISVDVEVDLDDFEDRDLVEALKSRKYTVIAPGYQGQSDYNLKQSDLELLISLIDKESETNGSWLKFKSLRDKLMLAINGKLY